MEDNPKNEQKEGKSAETGVILEVTSGDAKTEKHVRFHTPTLLDQIRVVDDTAQIRIVAHDGDGNEPRVLLAGTKADAIKALEQSCVPAESLMPELQKFARFLTDHSTLQAIGIHAICVDKDGNDAGFGFVTTAETCTAAQAVALVNCGDANINEFVTKAKLAIPGRAGEPAPGTVITPTPDQIEKLG